MRDRRFLYNERTWKVSEAPLELITKFQYALQSGYKLGHGFRASAERRQTMLERIEIELIVRAIDGAGSP